MSVCGNESHFVTWRATAGNGCSRLLSHLVAHLVAVVRLTSVGCASGRHSHGWLQSIVPHVANGVHRFLSTEKSALKTHA
eukprot:4982350-Amphidinium_carterae.2